MIKITHTITIVGLALFLASWAKLLPAPSSHYAFLLSPPAIIISLLFSSVGLDKPSKTILKATAAIILVISIALSFYTVFYAGERIVLLVLGVLFWNKGEAFNMLLFSTNWFWFTLLSYAAIEIPFMLLYCCIVNTHKNISSHTY